MQSLPYAASPGFLKVNWRNTNDLPHCASTGETKNETFILIFMYNLIHQRKGLWSYFTVVFNGNVCYDKIILKWYTITSKFRYWFNKLKITHNSLRPRWLILNIREANASKSSTKLSSNVSDVLINVSLMQTVLQSWWQPLSCWAAGV